MVHFRQMRFHIKTFLTVTYLNFLRCPKYVCTLHGIILEVMFGQSSRLDLVRLMSLQYGFSPHHFHKDQQFLLIQAKRIRQKGFAKIVCNRNNKKSRFRSHYKYLRGHKKRQIVFFVIMLFLVGKINSKYENFWPPHYIPISVLSTI